MLKVYGSDWENQGIISIIFLHMTTNFLINLDPSNVQNW